MMMEKFGFSPFIDLTGVKVSVLFKLENHEKLISLITSIHRNILEHWIQETRFFLGFIFHLDLNENGTLKYQNLMQTGAQDKENKNKKQRMFFKFLSRKNSNQNAVIDVLIRDMEDSSITMREHGDTKPVHK